MGSTLTYGLVYGVPFEIKGKLADDAEEAIDIEFLISDNYSFLEYESAGYNKDGGVQSIAAIAGMGLTHYSEPMMDIGKVVKKTPSSKAMDELNAFCSKYKIPCNPSWYVYATYG